MDDAGRPQGGPSPSTGLLGLPNELLQSVLATAGMGGVSAAVCCSELAAAFSQALGYVQLATTFLVERFGTASAARHLFAPGIQQALLGARAPATHDATLCSLLKELAARGAEIELHEALLLSQAAKEDHVHLLELLVGLNSSSALEQRQLLQRPQTRIWGASRHGPSTFALSRALTAAAQNGRARAVATLLRAGAPAAAYNNAALEAAAQGGNPEVVYRLCAAGADPTADGGAALRAAVCGGHTAAARVLLQYGADARARCSAALLHACELPAAAVAAVVVTAVADPVPAVAAAAATPLAVATSATRSSACMAAPTSPTRPPAAGPCSPSRSWGHASCDSPVPRFLSGNASDCVSPFKESLNQAPAAAPQMTSSPYWPYHSNPLQVQQQQQGKMHTEADIVEMVALLLAAGADARAHGRASLEAAAARGYERVVRLLLRAGADPAACNSSALVAASVQGHEGVVGLLLESGADPWDMSSLALRTASDRGFGALVDRLRAAACLRASGGSNSGVTGGLSASGSVPPGHTDMGSSGGVVTGHAATGSNGGTPTPKSPLGFMYRRGNSGRGSTAGPGSSRTGPALPGDGSCSSSSWVASSNASSTNATAIALAAAMCGADRQGASAGSAGPKAQAVGAWGPAALFDLRVGSSSSNRKVVPGKFGEALLWSSTFQEAFLSQS